MPLASSMALKCATSSVAVPRRHPGQHDAERGAALPRVLQQLPDRRVGVPAGAGHEQPQVGGVEELVGEVVSARAPPSRCPGCRAARSPWTCPRLAASTSSPSRPGRARPSCRTRGSVGRNMFSANQWMSSGWQASTGRVGGRPPYPGRADLRADDAVDQGGLAGPGGADQGHQQRRGGPPHPGQQVVVDLAEQLAPFGGDLVGAGDVKDQRDGRDPLAQVQQGRLEQPGVDPDLAAAASVRPDDARFIPGHPGKTAPRHWHYFTTCGSLTPASSRLALAVSTGQRRSSAAVPLPSMVPPGFMLV